MGPWSPGDKLTVQNAVFLEICYRTVLASWNELVVKTFILNVNEKNWVEVGNGRALLPNFEPDRSTSSVYEA